MVKSERKFLEILEEKAQEERRVMESGVLPQWAAGVGLWLAIHPWRVIIPISGLIYLSSRLYYGSQMREFILALFGGFVR